MGVEKMSVSFEPELGEAIHASAEGAGQTVSAWLSGAARDRLRLEALGEAMTAWEAAYGPLSEAEVANAERSLADAAESRHPGAS